MLTLARPAKLLTLLSILVLFAFIFTTFASATLRSNKRILGETDTATDSAKKKPKGRDKLEDRLSQIKLKVCEKRESSIQKRSTRLVAKSENIQKRFDRIIEKVDTYYIDVLMLKDVEIENYDELLGNVEENRAAAATKLGAAESTASNFTCEGENPKEQIGQFRTDMKGVISALKGYKKSVVNLIVAVRTKAKNIKDSEPVATDSAKPATESAGTE